MSAGHATITAEEIQAARQVAARNLPSVFEIAYAKAVLSGAFDTDLDSTFEDRARQVIAKVAYKDWWFERVNTPGQFTFRVAFHAVDTASRERTIQRGRHWLLTPNMTDAEIVRTALLAVLTAEEHEARESFLYDGKPLFGPHFDLPS